MDFSLTGKVAIVTGAGGAIGADYARALTEEGAAVAVVDLNGERAEIVASGLREGGAKAIAVTVDIADQESVAAMVERVVKEWNGVDILVNDAALMAEIPNSTLATLPIDVWDKVMKVNVAGPLIVSQAVIPHMKAGGGGRIINQSSGGAWRSATAYAVSKLAVVGLTQGLARELGPDGITVNCIAPGSMDNETTHRMFPPDHSFWTLRAKQGAIPRLGTNQDLCGALVYLASDAASWVTGQTLNVDGGWIMRS